MDPEIFGWMGTLTAIFLLMTPLQAARLMVRAGTTGGRQPQQYIAMFIASVLWVLYGLLMGSASIVLCNSVGIVSGSACLIMYVRVLIVEVGRTARLVSKTINMIMLAGTGCLAYVVYAFTMRKYPDTVSHIGYSAAVCAVWMFAAPLAQMKDIVRTRSAAVLSPLLLGAAAVNCSIWFIYGVLRSAPPVWGPNGMAFLVTLPQIALYLKYGGGVAAVDTAGSPPDAVTPPSNAPATAGTVELVSVCAPAAGSAPTLTTIGGGGGSFGVRDAVELPTATSTEALVT